MSFIAHYYNKKSKTTYCYRVTSYRDPLTGKPKSHRVLIGKLDENGEMVPTQKRGRPREDDQDAVLGVEIVEALKTKEIESYKSELKKLKEERQAILAERDDLRREINELKKIIKSMCKDLQHGLELAETISE